MRTRVRVTTQATHRDAALQRTERVRRSNSALSLSSTRKTAMLGRLEQVPCNWQRLIHATLFLVPCPMAYAEHVRHLKQTDVWIVNIKGIVSPRQYCTTSA
jgi:hypothetical protein